MNVVFILTLILILFLVGCAQAETEKTAEVNQSQSEVKKAKTYDIIPDTVECRDKKIASRGNCCVIPNSSSECPISEKYIFCTYDDKQVVRDQKTKECILN